jgi:hypothetical protein
MSENIPDTAGGRDGGGPVARAILDAMVGASAFVTGRVPDGWPDSLIPPPPAVALGGVSFGHSITAVFAYPAAAERPVDAYRAFLEHDGWTLQEEFISGGFAPMDLAMRRDTSLVTLRTTTSADRSVVVSVEPYDEPPSLSELRDMRFDTLGIPYFEPPPGVRFDSGGGGTSGDGTYRHARVLTDLTPAGLLPFYANQMAGAGWTTLERCVSTSTATLWVEALDSYGHTWRGMLSVYVNGTGREVFLFMAKSRASNEI